MLIVEVKNVNSNKLKNNRNFKYDAKLYALLIHAKMK
jgi:hypothetical protein